MCLAYIIDSSPNITTEDSNKLFPLSTYAAGNCFDHYIAAGDAAIDSTAEALLMCFLIEEPYFKGFLLSLQPRETDNIGFELFGDRIYFASWFGFTRILKKLVQMESKGNCLGGPSGIALQAGAQKYRSQKKPCLEILKVLLEAGFDINTLGGYRGSAIQVASYMGNIEAVKYLLSHGADINLTGGRHGCALQAAVCQRNDETTEYLVEHGANVNAEGGKYGTALIAAAGKGRWMILKLLLEKGADVNRTSKDYGTAMYQCLKKLINQLHFPGYLGNELSMRHMERVATGIHRLVHGGADPNISGAS
jgi:hypothetical protein